MQNLCQLSYNIEFEPISDLQTVHYVLGHWSSSPHALSFYNDQDTAQKHLEKYKDTQ